MRIWFRNWWAIKRARDIGSTTPPTGPTNALLTEAGDFLQTEDGNYLVQE